MKKFLITIALFTVLMQLPAFADEGIRVRSDGKITDKNGNIIAVQNPDDVRNDDYNKYYSSLDANGRSSGKSDFYVVSDPDKGFVRKEINTPSTLPKAQTSAQTGTGQVPANMDFTPSKKTTAIMQAGTAVSKPSMIDAPVQNSPSDAVYSNMNNAQTLYGK